MAKKKQQQSEEKAPEKQGPPTRIERFTQEMAVALTKEDVAERADRAAHLHSDLAQHEEDFDVVRKEHRTKLSGIRADILRLLSEVREKVTHKDVPCERHFLYEQRLVRDVRTDTGEAFLERPMTEQETQRAFDFEGGGGAGGSGDVDDEFSEGGAE